MSEQHPWPIYTFDEQENRMAIDNFILMGEQFGPGDPDLNTNVRLYRPNETNPVPLELEDISQPLPISLRTADQVPYPDLRTEVLNPSNIYLHNGLGYNTEFGSVPSSLTSPTSGAPLYSLYSGSTPGSPFMQDTTAWVPDFDPYCTLDTTFTLPPAAHTVEAFAQPGFMLEPSSMLGQHQEVPQRSSQSHHQQQRRRRRNKGPIQCPVAECEQRNKQHRSKRDLNRHIWANHKEYAADNKTPEEREKCQICGIESRKDNTKRHMRSQHGA